MFKKVLDSQFGSKDIFYVQNLCVPFPAIQIRTVLSLNAINATLLALPCDYRY